MFKVPLTRAVIDFGLAPYGYSKKAPIRVPFAF